MGVSAAIDFESEVRAFFDLFDRQDIEGLRKRFAEDVQGVDEISRGWLRNSAAIDDYFAQLQAMEVSDVHSSLSDIAVRQWDDMALVTCIAEQSYRVGGKPVEITAPVSMLYRRTHDEWRVALVHAVPFPAED